MNSEQRKLWLVLLVVSLFAAFVYFYRLGVNSIANADEGVHTLVTREIRERPDWLTLHIRGVEYFRKPPLAFWIRAVAENIFGERELTVRLPSALAGVATTLLLSWWAWLLTRRWSAAMAVGIIFPLLPITFIHTFRTGETDGILLFLLTAAAFVLWRSLLRPWLLVPAAALVGLALMTKSVAAVVVPFGFILALLIHRRWPYHRQQVAVAVVAFFAVAAPWHIHQHVTHGSKFWKEYVGFHVIERFEQRLHVTPKQHGAWWYAPAVEQGMFPWSWLIIPAIAAAIVQLRGRPRDEQFGHTFLICWGLGTVFLFTLAATKLAWYIAPAYPALALLVALLVTAATRSWPRWMWMLSALFAIAYLYRAFQLYNTGFSRLLALALPPPLAVAVVVSVAGLAIIWAFRRSGRHGQRMLIFLSGMVIVHMLLVSAVIYSRNVRRPYESPFRIFRNEIEARSPLAPVYIYHIGYYTSPLAHFYLVGPNHKRQLTPLREKPADLADVVRVNPGAFVIFEGTELPAEVPGEKLQRLKIFQGDDGALSLYQVQT